jgi:hypothetical protein
VTSEGHPDAVLQRALKERNLWVAEAIARDLPRPMPLEDALKLVYLYASKESPKFERAAMKFLRRLPGREGADAQELREGRARARTGANQGVASRLMAVAPAGERRSRSSPSAPGRGARARQQF